MYYQIRIDDEDIILLKEKGYTIDEITTAISSCLEMLSKVFHNTALKAAPASVRRQQIEKYEKLTNKTDLKQGESGDEDQTDDFNKWVNNLGGEINEAKTNEQNN